MVDFIFVDIDVDHHGGFRIDIHHFDFSKGKHMPKHYSTTMPYVTAKEVAEFIITNSLFGITRVIFDEASYGISLKRWVESHMANCENRENRAYLDHTGIIRKY